MSAGCAERRCPDPTGQACHCAACHNTFGGLGLFDAHQDVDHGRTPPVICRDPAEMRVSLDNQISRKPDAVALVQDGHGVWMTPAGLAGRQRAADRLAKARRQ